MPPTLDRPKTRKPVGVKFTEVSEREDAICVKLKRIETLLGSALNQRDGELYRLAERLRLAVNQLAAADLEIARLQGLLKAANARARKKKANLSPRPPLTPPSPRPSPALPALPPVTFEPACPPSSCE